VNVDEIVSIIEEVADPRFAASWDLSGLHVRGEKKDIKKIGVALDPTTDTILKAIDQGCEFILTHHPTTLKPALPNKDNNYTKVLRLLFKAGAWLYCAHTSLDVNVNGPVSWLADVFGLENKKPIEPISEHDPLSKGFGIIGILKNKISFSQFLKLLCSTLNKKSFLTIGEQPEFVEKIAYCPGSGMSLAHKAFSLGAQVFISGDIKYHLAQEIESLGYSIDVGHFILEELMMKNWAEMLNKKLQSYGVKVYFIEGKEPIKIKEV